MFHHLPYCLLPTETSSSLSLSLSVLLFPSIIPVEILFKMRYLLKLVHHDPIVNYTMNPLILT